MPRIYLSPSTQEGNMYVTGGSEEYYMNLIADAMEPYLVSSGIQYTRNSPDMTASDAIRESNRGNYDLHVALHSNAAPEGQYGTYTGIDVYYSPISTRGRRAAQIFVRNLKTIYPNPSKVRVLTTTTIGEVTQTRAPAVFLELGYHDNVSDANWVTGNIERIAANLVLSLTEYFGIPFIEPMGIRRGVVRVSSGTLNLREKPSRTSRIIASIPNGAPLTVVGQWQGWYVVNYRGLVGYVDSRYVNIP
ncbi:MAG: N-acetylmuramoyl-L-alanine amidase [Clostridia bacterium]|nr:N-acetylmuramoyl-L-alanine amidase [Clostridia bacterium]